MPRNRGRSVLALTLLFLLATATLLLLAPTKKVRAQTSRVVPDRVLYWNIFRHVIWLKHRADAAQEKGKDRSSLRRIVAQKIGLSDAQGATLESVALQCEADVAVVDKKAAPIIKKARSQYVAGMVPKGFSLPATSPELTELQAERNQTILRCRDTLHGLLGEEGFTKVDQFARTVAARTPPRAVRPAALPVGGGR